MLPVIKLLSRLRSYVAPVGDAARLVSDPAIYRNHHFAPTPADTVTLIGGPPSKLCHMRAKISL